MLNLKYNFLDDETDEITDGAEGAGDDMQEEGGGEEM